MVERSRDPDSPGALPQGWAVWIGVASLRQGPDRTSPLQGVSSKIRASSAWRHPPTLAQAFLPRVSIGTPTLETRPNRAATGTNALVLKRGKVERR